MNSILIVDDDRQLRQSFQRLLSEEGYEVRTAASGEEGVEMVKQKIPDLVIMDVRMPGMNGLEAFRAMRKTEPKLPVIIMTAYSTTDTAIEATKMGAFDYVLKPFEIPDILTLIEQAIEAGRLMRTRVAMDVVPETAPPDTLIGKSEQMQEVYKAIGRAAPTDATVLIRGESGTGKELVARAIYQHSLRADKPFLVINCVAIPETLLESELFGYEKGAFTGAVNRRVGKIEQANGGTVFLDEIGDMPLSIQAKILRLLQEKSIERLGAAETIAVDVRIIAATNRNLEEALASGRLRDDLYYRLKVVTITLPPLSERKGDISLLCNYFLNRFANDMSITNPGITDEALTMLENQPLHGNVRELANTLQKALIFNRGYPIRAEDISFAVESGAAQSALTAETADNILKQWIRENLVLGGREDFFSFLSDRFTNVLVTEALKLTRGNRTRAARLLGISRPTLHAKMEKCGFTEQTDAEEE
ncbi:MAG: sigma-54 dependent transcriptional regulator [bacterium]